MDMNFREKLDDILERTKNLSPFDEKELDIIRNKIDLYSEKMFGDKSKYGKKSHNISFHPMVYPCSHELKIDRWRSGREQLVNLIETMIEENEMQDNSLTIDDTQEQANSKKVFIVHGHNDKLKYNVSNWLYSIGLEPIILHLQPNGGTGSILSKIDANADVRCAIVLMTGDDEGKSKLEKNYKSRARQNVVFEAGYFIGKLGADKVILLYEEDVEMIGDLSGCIYILADEYDGWKESVRKELDYMDMI